MKKRTLIIISILSVLIIGIIGYLGYLKYHLIRHPDIQKTLKGAIMARDYKDEKTLDKAEKLFKEAIEINPDRAEAYIGLGGVYSSQKRFKEAENAFKKAIELNPNSAGVYYAFGVCYRAQERYDEAARMFSKALEINPKDEYAQIFLQDVKLSKLWKEREALSSKGSSKLSPEEKERLDYLKEQIEKIMKELK